MLLKPQLEDPTHTRVIILNLVLSAALAWTIIRRRKIPHLIQISSAFTVIQWKSQAFASVQTHFFAFNTGEAHVGLL